MFWKAPLSWKWSPKVKKEFSLQFQATMIQPGWFHLSPRRVGICLGQSIDRKKCIKLPRDAHGALLSLGCVLESPGELLKLWRLRLHTTSMKSEAREGVCGENQGSAILTACRWLQCSPCGWLLWGPYRDQGSASHYAVPDRSLKQKTSLKISHL